MTRRVLAALLAVLLIGVPAVASAAQGEHVAVVRVHGNNVTPESEIATLAAVRVGDLYTDSMLVDVRRRLVDSGRFEGVDVLKRFASIADPAAIALVIIVDEFPVSVRQPREPEATHPDAPPRVVRRRWPRNAMWLPILEAEDGHGLTYGAVLAWPDVAGPRSRLAVPLSWGGQRQAAVELDRAFPDGWVSRLRGGVGLTRRVNPAFDVADTRRRLWVRVERQFARVWWAGADAALERVGFDTDHRVTSVGADVTLDTRLDPNLPRNAIYARVGWTRYGVDDAHGFDAATVDLRGYVGLVGQTVLVARGAIDAANRSRPPYLQPLVGGWSNLRGFRAGAFTGDTSAVGSLELRVPVSSPLSLARTGFSVFVDAGTAYDRGVRFGRAPVHVGAGAGLWVSAAVLQMGVSVAHGRHSGTRANVNVGLTF